MWKPLGPERFDDYFIAVLEAAHVGLTVATARCGPCGLPLMTTSTCRNAFGNRDRTQSGVSLGG
jgi:hypothetical protein